MKWLGEMPPSPSTYGWNAWQLQCIYSRNPLTFSGLSTISQSLLNTWVKQHTRIPHNDLSSAQTQGFLAFWSRFQSIIHYTTTLSTWHQIYWKFILIPLSELKKHHDLIYFWCGTKCAILTFEIAVTVLLNPIRQNQKSLFLNPN